MSDFADTLPLDPPPATEYAPAPQRRRWPWVLLVLVLVLGAAAVAGEFIARGAVERIVRTEAIKALDLPADHPIEVATEGLVLPQVIGGTLTSLSATSENVALGPITADVSANATGIPIRGDEPVGTIDGTVVVAQDQLLQLLKDQELPLENLTIEGGQVTGEGAFSLLGLSMPVSITLELGVENGTIMVMPVSAEAAGITLDGERLRQALGGLGARFLGPYPVCIAQYLPKAFTVTGIELSGGAATVDVDVDGKIVTDPTLVDPGVCS